MSLIKVAAHPPAPHPHPTLNLSTFKKEQLEQECLTDGNFHLNNFFPTKNSLSKKKRN